MKRGALIIVSILAIIAANQAASTPRGSNASEDKDARSYLMVPADGVAVSNLVKFVFSLGGMGVAPA